MLLYPTMTDPLHSSSLVMTLFLFVHGWWNHSPKEIWRWMNASLTTGCRVSENAFGIMTNHWRCLLKAQEQNPKTVKSIVTAFGCLQNICRILYPGNAHVDRDNANHEIIPGEWRDNADLTELQRLRGNLGTRTARQQRLYLKKYYSSEAGVVPS